MTRAALKKLADETHTKVEKNMAARAAFPTTTLADLLGPLTYLGCCAECGGQFMSVNERAVWAGDGAGGIVGMCCLARRAS